MCGQADGDARAGFVGLNVQFALELTDAFAHAAEADARTFRANLGELFWSHAAALVLNGEMDGIAFTPEVDYGGLAAGVAMDVR